MYASVKLQERSYVLLALLCLVRGSLAILGCIWLLAAKNLRKLEEKLKLNYNKIMALLRFATGEGVLEDYVINSIRVLEYSALLV